MFSQVVILEIFGHFWLTFQSSAYLRHFEKLSESINLEGKTLKMENPRPTHYSQMKVPKLPRNNLKKNPGFRVHINKYPPAESITKYTCEMTPEGLMRDI